MILVVSGSRTITNKEFINKALMNMPMGDVREVVHGGCRGPDSIFHDLLDGHLPIKVFPADWHKHGRSAGPIRNAQMAEYGDALLAVWDGNSRGTMNMIKEMQRRGKPVAVVFSSYEAEVSGYSKLGWIHDSNNADKT